MIFTILFFAAKPVMLKGHMNPEGADGDKHIDLYSFSGMSFSPCNLYIARNYTNPGDSSRIAEMAIAVNNGIESGIYEYLEDRYSSYNVTADIARNDRNETVISFSGTGDGEAVKVDMTIDWKKAAESGNNCISV